MGDSDLCNILLVYSFCVVVFCVCCCCILHFCVLCEPFVVRGWSSQCCSWCFLTSVCRSHMLLVFSWTVSSCMLLMDPSSRGHWTLHTGRGRDAHLGPKTDSNYNLKFKFSLFNFHHCVFCIFIIRQHFYITRISDSLGEVLWKCFWIFLSVKGGLSYLSIMINNSNMIKKHVMKETNKQKKWSPLPGGPQITAGGSVDLKN